MKYYPRLKDTVSVIWDNGNCLLKASSNEGFELSLNNQGQIIIQEILKERDIEYIYKYVFENSNASSIEIIEEQIDKFLIDLSLRRVYMADDDTGYLLMKRMSDSHFYLDPSGYHTLKLIKDKNYSINYNSFYFNEKTVLAKRFLTSMHNNQMFSVIDNKQKYIFILKFHESFELFEIVAVLGLSSNNMLPSYFHHLNDSLEKFNFSLRNFREKIDSVIIFKTHEEKLLLMQLDITRNGILKNEYDNKDCFIYTLT